MVQPIAFKPRRPCPICARPSQQKFHPFCSGRCAEVDLNRWLGGNYAVAAAEEEDLPAGNPPTDQV